MSDGKGSAARGGRNSQALSSSTTTASSSNTKAVSGGDHVYYIFMFDFSPAMGASKLKARTQQRIIRALFGKFLPHNCSFCVLVVDGTQDDPLVEPMSHVKDKQGAQFVPDQRRTATYRGSSTQV